MVCSSQIVGKSCTENEKLWNTDEGDQRRRNHKFMIDNTIQSLCFCMQHTCRTDFLTDAVSIEYRHALMTGACEKMDMSPAIAYLERCTSSS